MEKTQMIWCKGEGRRIPFGGCERRQQKVKNRCVKTCEFYVNKKEKIIKRRDSKMNQIREAFKQKETYSLNELMEISNFDKNNLLSAISILKNKKRTKNLLYIDYDRKNKTFTLKGEKDG